MSLEHGGIVSLILYLALSFLLYDVEVGVSWLIWIALLLFGRSMVFRIKAYSLVQIIFYLYILGASLVIKVSRLVNGIVFAKRIYRVDKYIVAFVIDEFYVLSIYGHSLIKHWTRRIIFPKCVYVIFWRVAQHFLIILVQKLGIGIMLIKRVQKFIVFLLHVGRNLIKSDKLWLLLFLSHFCRLWCCRFGNNLFLLISYNWVSVRFIAKFIRIVILLAQPIHIELRILRNWSSSDSGRVFEHQCFVGTFSVIFWPIYFLHHLVFFFSFNYWNIALNKKTQTILFSLLEFLGLQLMQTRLVIHSALSTG